MDIYKSHVNDAFVMESFHPKHRCQTCHFPKEAQKPFLAFLRTCPGARIAFDRTTELYQAVPYLASEEDAAE